MSGRVTMRDLAKSVGMSPMTVSRALRNDETVSAETRNRIQKVAHEMGYVYDTTAQAFRTQKSGFVAVTLPSVNNANFAETYRALSTALADSGMQILLGATNYRIDREEILVRQLLARNPEALVLTGGFHTDATRDLVAARGVPVVEMWDLPAKPLGHVVGFSNFAAMEPLIEHLAHSGRRKLAFVGASEGGDLRGAERRAGAIAAAEKLGLPPISVLDAGEAPVSMRHGARLAEKQGRALLKYDGIVCVSDPVAFGVLSACARLGIDVPGQLAVTGFGHFEVAAIAEPKITTVDVQARQIGETAAELLLNLADSKDVPRVEKVDVRLVVGGTT
ncbi:MAG: LacI family DNA-binding transcriptional regulator [Paracoccaceae bacterium]